MRLEICVCEVDSCRDKGKKVGYIENYQDYEDLMMKLLIKVK